MPSKRRRSTKVIVVKKKRKRHHPQGSIHGSLSGLMTRVHSFRRCVYTETFQITCGATGNAFVSSAFQLSDLPAVSEFTTLFEMFRIQRVTYTLIAKQGTTVNPGKDQTAFPNTNPAQMLPSIVGFKDPDDAILPSGTASFTERGLVPHPWPRSRKWSMNINPLRQSSVDLGGTVNVPRIRWTDMAAPSQSHFGLKIWIIGTPLEDMQFTRMLTYYFQCKGVR